MVYLLGGPAPLDTYDLKPNAPAEYRGEFKPINTNVAGVEISELFPQQAKMMDKFALIRSLSATAPNNHSDSEVMTGRNEIENARFQHPCIGSVVSKFRGDVGRERAWLRGPAEDVLSDQDSPAPIVVLSQSGCLGRGTCAVPADRAGHERFRFCTQRWTAQRFLDRMDLLSRFDRMRRDIDAAGSMSALDAFQGQAAEILTSPQAARCVGSEQGRHTHRRALQLRCGPR